MYLSPLKPLWPTPALLSQSPAHNPSSDQSWTHSHESSLEVGKHTVWQYVPEVQRISYSLSGGVIRLLWLSLIPLTNTHTLGCIDLSSFGSRLFTIRPCCRRKSDTSPWEDSMRVLTSSVWIIVALQWQNWTNRPTQSDTISKEDVWVATLCNCGAIS